jgi:uracil-DNA glycosylase
MKKKQIKIDMTSNLLGFSSLNAASKLYEKLKSSGWNNLLKTFILSSEFLEILQKLSANVADEKRFSPSLKEIFKAFELCNFDNVKVVIVGTEPQLEPGVADGLAFSGKKSNLTTDCFKNALKEGLCKDVSLSLSESSLSDLAKQGVLLLNLALTAEIDKPNKHLKLWDPFTTYLLDMLSIEKPDLIWVFQGELPCSMAQLVKNGTVFKIKSISDWKTNALCSQIDEKLNDLGFNKINW